MNKIQRLSPEIIAKIAAGEVIERPGFAVKELIDNAIDAGAKNIYIDIEKSGLKKIEIRDDGEGMNRQDLVESFKPHTTSKIQKETDLYSIKTFGFRGEALSSIAAISDLTIISRDSFSNGGTKIHLESGVLESDAPIAHPVGTTIIVSQLFSSVPARKSFLKSSRTEFRHILDIVINFSISYPDIHFTLIHNKKVILDLPKTDQLIKRIIPLFGSTVANNIFSLSFESSYIKLTGLFGKPQIQSRNIQNYHLFINKRSVKEKLIVSAIKDAYGSLLEKNAYPFFILFIELPFEAVDVNVHPRKEQVSFLDHSFIYEMIVDATKQSLANNSLLITPNQSRKSNTITEQILKDNVIPWQKRNLFSLKPRAEIMQMHNLFLVAEATEGIVVIDQHAAHERILYEKLISEFKKQKQELLPYHLKSPKAFELSLSDAQIIDEYMYLFKNLGFEIEHFKDTFFLLRTVPFLFKDRNFENLIKEMLDDILEQKDVSDIDKQTQKLIAYLACRTAIKRGDPLSPKQTRAIIKALEKTDNNASCPHGRPIKIEFNFKDLNKSFRRT